jgi:hypothetical protein
MLHHASRRLRAYLSINPFGIDERRILVGLKGAIAWSLSNANITFRSLANTAEHVYAAA